MLITTSPNLEGYKIAEYCGTVMAMASSPAANNYEKRQSSLHKAKRVIEKDMEKQAAELGANAIVSLSYGVVTKWRWDQSLFGSGTAVKAEAL